MKRLLLFILLFLLHTSSASSQSHWIKHPGNPVVPAVTGYAVDPAVVYNPHLELYQMWYTGWYNGAHHIYYATSVDGINWGELPGLRVFSPGESGSWDDWTIRVATVIYDDENYKLYYFGKDYARDQYQIGVALSSDGIHWERFNGNPVIIPGSGSQWDNLQVMYPHVVKSEDTYWMWYSADHVEYVYQIGLATSTDGLHWEKFAGNPIHPFGFPGNGEYFAAAGSVIRHNNQFIMLYYGSDLDVPVGHALGLATSENGIEWDIYPGNPVFTRGPAGSWDHARIGLGTIMVRGNEFKMWFHGNDNSQWQIGCAESVNQPAEGFALEFDGINDMVTIPDPNQNFDLDNFTIEAWVYRYEANSNHMIISKSVAGEYPAVNSNFWLWVTANNHAGAGWELPNSSNFEVEGETIIQPHRWYHLAAVNSVEDHTFRIYVNGHLDTEPLPTEGVPNHNNLPVILGNTPNVSQEYFQGRIDNVRIWDRVRSPEEITAAMFHSLSGSEFGLMGVWDLNEGQGQAVHDHSIHENHGYRGTATYPDPNDPGWVISNIVVEPGSDIHLSAESIHFGPIRVGMFAEQALEITNLSPDHPLVMNGFQLNSPVFILGIDVPQVEIWPFQTVSIPIIFHPDEPIFFESTLLIHTNHPNIPVIEIPIFGQGMAFGEAPHITSIQDFPDDWGGYVRVRWLPSGHDMVETDDPLEFYSLWRRVNEAIPTTQNEAELINDELWDFIVSVPGVHFDEYAYVAPTLVDFGSDNYWSTFMVSAHTLSGAVYFSEPDSGYSINNHSEELDIDPETLFSRFELYQNYPNPFNPTTTIAYQIPTDCQVQLNVYNTVGQLVDKLVNREMEPGFHQVDWKIKNSSGVYFYELKAQPLNSDLPEFIDRKRMILMK